MVNIYKMFFIRVKLIFIKLEVKPYLKYYFSLKVFLYEIMN